MAFSRRWPACQRPLHKDLSVEGMPSARKDRVPTPCSAANAHLNADNSNLTPCARRTHRAQHQPHLGTGEAPLTAVQGSPGLQEDSERCNSIARYRYWGQFVNHLNQLVCVAALCLKSALRLTITV
jgi:hypothetical protein